MEQEEKTIISVAEYISFMNETLREHMTTQDLAVEGEVSDFRISQGKWISFDLKDEEEQAVLKCFMTVWQLKTPIEDGMRIAIKGFPKVYERFGQLKMNVQSVELVGEGALRRAYELLKKKLESEGLFDISRKRSLPRFPQKIGLITSREAAAYGDFLRILNNRWGGVEVLHTHVHVQGKEAVREIMQAFGHFQSLPKEERPDVLVLTRGGGGLEDLHAFNDEQVARAVFQSVIPVVCGVGHERDESLCDYVADVRASTPSNAAERIVPDRNEILRELQMMTAQQEGRLQERIDGYQRAIDHVTHIIAIILEREKQRFQHLFERFLEKTSDWLPGINEQFEQLQRFLQQVNPERVLARGYSIVRTKKQVIKDAKDLSAGQRVEIQLHKGSFEADVANVGGKGQQTLV